MSIRRQQQLADVTSAPHRRAAEAEAWTPEAVLRWGIARWGRRVALVTSFQVGGMVLLDMAARIDPGVRVLTVDTGRLPQETFELIERVRARYGVEVEVLFPEFTRVEEMVRRDGPDLFRGSVAKRLECCETRKSAPLKRALEGLDGWITGARRDQASSRSTMGKLAWDPVHGGVMKLAPLANWSEEDVWAYAREREVPHHELYDRGYRSIGCAPCTRAVAAGEHPRAGRWWWESNDRKECGLHVHPRLLDLEGQAS